MVIVALSPLFCKKVNGIDKVKGNLQFHGIQLCLFGYDFINIWLKAWISFDKFAAQTTLD